MFFIVKYGYKWITIEQKEMFLMYSIIRESWDQGIDNYLPLSETADGNCDVSYKRFFQVSIESICGIQVSSKCEFNQLQIVIEQ